MRPDFAGRHWRVLSNPGRAAEDEPEVLVAASPLPRRLKNPMTPVPFPPRRRIRADDLCLYMHGRLMSVEDGPDATLGVKAPQPDPRGSIDIFANFQVVIGYNNLCELCRRLEFATALSRTFTKSLGVYVELLSVLTLGPDVPQLCSPLLAARSTSGY